MGMFNTVSLFCFLLKVTCNFYFFQASFLVRVLKCFHLSFSPAGTGSSGKERMGDGGGEGEVQLFRNGSLEQLQFCFLERANSVHRLSAAN